MRKPAAIFGAGVATALLVIGGVGVLTGTAGAQSGGTAWLGVYTQSIGPELREGMDYDGEGVLVTRVVSGSPADRAGVQKGDVIVSIGGRTVDTSAELLRAVRARNVGESANLSVWRDGSRRSLSARLTSRPASADDDEESWSDETWEDGSEGPIPRVAPIPPRTPRTPRAPTAPREPRTYWFDDGDMGNLMNLRGLNRGRLGVMIQDLNPSLGEALDVPDGDGVLITEVVEDTPAERAGLKAGDVIVRVNDRDVNDTGDLRDALGQVDEGRVTLIVVRKGARRTVDAELERAARTRMFERRTPEADRRVVRRFNSNDGDAGSREELRELREELRKLREKLDRLERN